MKKILALVLTLVLAFSISATALGEGYKIGFSDIYLTPSWMQQMKGMLDTRVDYWKEKGVISEFTLANANGDNSKQIADIQNMVAEGYDAIIIANGSRPLVPNLPGIHKPHVSWAPHAEMGKAPVGDKIVVIGAGAVGLEAAIEFVDKGKHVDVVEMADHDSNLGKLYASSGTSAKEFMSIIDQKQLPVHYGTKLLEITDDKVICQDVASGKTVEFEADTVLLAMGLVPLQKEAEELRHCAPETDVYIIGDCKEIGTISGAVNGAFQAALHI